MAKSVGSSRPNIDQLLIHSGGAIPELHWIPFSSAFENVEADHQHHGRRVYVQALQKTSKGFSWSFDCRPGEHEFRNFVDSYCDDLMPANPKAYYKNSLQRKQYDSRHMQTVPTPMGTFVVQLIATGNHRVHWVPGCRESNAVRDGARLPRGRSRFALPDA